MKVVSSPAICNVAFLLRTTPAAFLATHQYTPASESFRPLTTRRKKSEPAGRSTRLAEGFTSSPSLYHSIVGVGNPSALQFRVAGSCRGTLVSTGCSAIRGERSSSPETINAIP